MNVEAVCTVLILVGVLATLYRVVQGPTLIDRVMALNVIGTKTIVVLALIGFLYDRPAMFLDIALAYALINFIATVALLRYLEALARQEQDPESEEEAAW